MITLFENIVYPSKKAFKASQQVKPTKRKFNQAKLWLVGVLKRKVN